MAWNNDGRIDAEEFGTILKLMSATSGSMDLGLLVKIDGSFIQGEVKGKSGIDMLAVFGYYLRNQLSADSSGELIPGTFWIIRDLDAATASLSSAMKACSGKSKKKLEVELRAFKAGAITVEAGVFRPVICFKLEGAHIVFQAFITNSPSGIPSEVIAFNYRSITIETTPQLASGQMGATRTCELSIS
jgi:type VI protein secretion system component Hcp